MLNKSKIYFIPKLFLFILILSQFSFSQPQNNLFQYSVISSLLQGNYDGDLTIGELKNHGDFGLGTFNNLNGEMIILDGIVYQVTSEGKVNVIPDEAKTPFAVAFFFKGSGKELLNNEMSLAGLSSLLDSNIESPNLIYAFKIEGNFSYIKTRSVPGQMKPYKTLVEVTKDQPTFEFINITGTIVGFRFPSFMDGVNVPGYHFHFLTEDRKSGGHVLDLQIQNSTIQLAAIKDFQLQFPSDEDFLKIDLSKKNSADLEKAEK